MRLIGSAEWMLALTMVVLLQIHALATDRFFGDISEESANKKYKVEAKSPDNEESKSDSSKRRVAFQSKFTYTCTEVESGRVLWTRPQDKDEASPTSIYLSDEAWTVIHTGWDQLICVDPKGVTTGVVNILDFFNAKERSTYVINSTAGELWQGNSFSYHANIGDKVLFTVRPWWGSRVVVDLIKGQTVYPDERLKKLLESHEATLIMKEFERAFAKRDELGDSNCSTWAYLSGVYKLNAAIPMLRALESSSDGGGSVSSTGFVKVDGRINPLNHSYNTLRQVVHLSLRRLGEHPVVFPATSFDIEYHDYTRNTPFVYPPLTIPRHLNAEKVKMGMSPESIIGLVGEPDFVMDSRWEYDLDTTPSSSLIVTWGQPISTRVGLTKEGPAIATWVQITHPGMWERQLVRDQQVSE